MSTKQLEDKLYEMANRHAKLGNVFDRSSVDPCLPEFGEWFGEDFRVKVTRTYESGEAYTRTGLVSITTGWKPALLLVHRRGAHGSSDLLDAKDKVIGVQFRDGGPYVPPRSK